MATAAVAGLDRMDLELFKARDTGAIARAFDSFRARLRKEPPPTDEGAVQEIDPARQHEEHAVLLSCRIHWCGRIIVMRAGTIFVPAHASLAEANNWISTYGLRCRPVAGSTSGVSAGSYPAQAGSTPAPATEEVDKKAPDMAAPAESGLVVDGVHYMPMPHGRKLRGARKIGGAYYVPSKEGACH